MQLPPQLTSAPHLTIGTAVAAALPYLDMGLRIFASIVAIYSGILYIRKLRASK